MFKLDINFVGADLNWIADRRPPVRALQAIDLTAIQADGNGVRDVVREGDFAARLRPHVARPEGPADDILHTLPHDALLSSLAA